jgi:hypothetical protein
MKKRVPYRDSATPQNLSIPAPIPVTSCIRLDIQIVISLTLLITAVIINSPLESYATSSGIGFYSPSSPPPGVKSLEPLIAKWWNWRTALPAATATNWPECLKGNGGIIGDNNL